MVALGGGADSQAVLDLTIRYRAAYPQHRYMAIHLDHAFHPKSPQWAEFLRQQCIEHDIEHIIEPIEVPIEGRQSKEAQGRLMRYQGLAARTDPNAIILLGHHLSDQSETFLLQLKRGSGPKGLAAMAPIARFVDQRLLCRPLLTHSKDEIYLYAKTRQLAWIEDDTNVDTLFDRNFLRHDVLPVLINRWPKFEQTVARSARLCAEQQHLLDELLGDELRRRSQGKALRVDGLTTSSPAFQRALIRLFVAEQGAPMPSEAQLQEVVRQLHGQRVQVRFGPWQLASFNQYLYVLPIFDDVSGFHWQGGLPSHFPESVRLPDGLGYLRFEVGGNSPRRAAHPVEPLRYGAEPDTASEAPPARCGELYLAELCLRVPVAARVEVGFCQPGDKMARRAGGRLHAVAKLLKKARIAPWWRQRLPAIWVDGELAWVAVLGRNAAHSSEGEMVMLNIAWQQGPKAPGRNDIRL